VADHAPLLENAFALDLCEGPQEIEAVEGDIPAFVRGTYYLNGPARFARGGLRYRHWLDGDGMVTALRLEGGQVSCTSRFVRGTKFTTEEEADRPVFRTFGTAFASDRLKRGVGTESPVNVSVYPYAGRLLAFGESTLPWELDPVTLHTRGKFDFGGRLNDISPFAAHPKFDAATGEMFNFGVSFSAREPRLDFYRFDRGAALIFRKQIPLPYPCAVHDFSLGPGCAVFYLAPYVLDVAALLREGRTTMDSLRWEPWRGSLLLIASRDTGATLAAVPLGRGYCLHLINCFEQDSRLVVDLLEFERPLYDQYQILPDLFTEVDQGRPVRILIDLRRGEVVGGRALDYRRAPDFPAIDPRRAGRQYREFWSLGISAAGRSGRKFFDQLAHADWEGPAVRDVYQAPPRHYLGGSRSSSATPTARRPRWSSARSSTPSGGRRPSPSSMPPRSPGARSRPSG
jgi:carotenoid cleavage dioxygenase-like enzyme